MGFRWDKFGAAWEARLATCRLSQNPRTLTMFLQGTAKTKSGWWVPVRVERLHQTEGNRVCRFPRFGHWSALVFYVASLAATDIKRLLSAWFAVHGTDIRSCSLSLYGFGRDSTIKSGLLETILTYIS
jgi:hypothetical protein